MADGSVVIDTEINNDGMKKGIKNIESGFDKLKSTITKTIAALGLGKLAKDFISTGIQYNAEVEKYQTALTTLTGSAEEANKIVKQIKQDAAATPFDVAGLTQANQLLISTGLDAEESRETILALGNAISATGGGNEELSRMAINLQQIKNTGKAAAIDIKQFAFAGIDIYGLLADYLKITKQEASEMEVTWEDLNGALLNASKEGGKYFGAMTNQSKTLNGQWSTLKDNFKEFTGAVLTPLTNLLKDTLLPSLNNFIGILSSGVNTDKWNELSNNLEIIKGIIISILGATAGFKIGQQLQLLINGFQNAQIALSLYKLQAEGASIAQGFLNGSLTFGETVVALLTGKITLAEIATGLWAKTQAFLNTVLLANPIAIVVALIAGLIAIVIYLWNTNEDFRNALIKIFETIKNKAIDVFEWFKNLPYNIGKIIGEMIGFLITLPIKIAEILIEAYKKFTKWFSDMKTIIPQKLPEIINAIKEKFKQLPKDMLNIGKNIVEGLWNGIKNAGNWIKEQVANFAKGILDGMKQALGIHSPSRVFRDEVGKNIALGVGEGFTRNIGAIYKQMKATVDFETQRLSSNITANQQINIERNSNVQATLDSIDNNREIVVNSTLEVDGRKMANTVNKVNAREKLRYGIA
jgi:tape measure domain-containing protein